MKVYFVILILIVNFLCRAGFNEIDSLQHIIKTTKNDSLKVKALYHLDGLIYISDAELDIQLNMQIMKICIPNLNRNVNNHKFYSNHLTEAYNTLGINQDKLGNYSLALDYFHNALAISEGVNDKNTSSIYNNIGSIYLKLKAFKLAKNYNIKALNLYKEINDSLGMTTSYNNIGNLLLLHEKKLDSALLNYHTALTIALLIEDTLAIAFSYSNIGVVHNQLGNQDSALFYYNKSLQICKATNDWNGLSNIYSNIGQIYLSQGYIEKAKFNCWKGIHISTRTHFKQRISKNCYCLYEAHKQSQNSDSALFYLEWYDSLNQILSNDDVLMEITKKEILFKTEKKSFSDSLNYVKNIQINKEKSIKLHAKNESRIAYLIAGLILFLLIGIVIFVRLNLIKRQKRYIEKQHQRTQRQKTIISNQKFELEQSINYAKLIQEATLPSLNHGDLFTDSFIYYNPKEAVSGDFFWLEEDDDQKYFAVADCTGHGIPGAFISIIGTILLNEIYNSKALKSPELILNELNRLIQLTLNSNGKQMNDGMDISFCAYNKQTGVLSYSGANNPIWVISKNETLDIKIDSNFELTLPTISGNGFNLFEIKADKQPIGKFYDFEKSFSLKKIQLTKDDLIYTFTDGFADQFGGKKGEKGKKYKYKPFKKLLLKIAHLKLSSQHQVLDKEFINWKNDLEQIDDICIMGIKI